MIATQTTIGDIGRKATTELSISPVAMVNVKGFQFALDADGIHILNIGDTDNGVAFSSSFTLATTDLEIKNPKQGRFFYIGYEVSHANDPMTISIQFDNQEWRTYAVNNNKTGLQRVSVPVGSNGIGRYMTIKITSTNPFKIDNIDGEFYILSSGNEGY